MRAQVEDFMSLLGHHAGKVAFHLEPGMVGAHRYSHREILAGLLECSRVRGSAGPRGFATLQGGRRAAAFTLLGAGSVRPNGRALRAAAKPRPADPANLK